MEEISPKGLNRSARARDVPKHDRQRYLSISIRRCWHTRWQQEKEEEVWNRHYLYGFGGSRDQTSWHV